MRLWTIHPQYLDNTALTRLWNDSIAALRLLQNGEEHSQLLRFQAQPEPLQALSDYMHTIADEAQARRINYAFRHESIPLERNGTHMTVTAGQMEFEIVHYGVILSKKRGNIDAWYEFWAVREHEPNPIFSIVPGAVERWEKLPPHDYTTCKVCGDPVYRTFRGQPPKLCLVCRSRNKHAP